MKQRSRFLTTLLIPFGYLYFAGIFSNLTSMWSFLKVSITDASLWLFLFLLALVVFFILLPDQKIKDWFKFCGMQEAEFEKDFKNRWEKVCYGLVYGSLGIFIVVSCLYKVGWLPLDWIPQELPNPQVLGRRIMWCFGWSLLGLSMASISDARRKSADVKSPFPSYIYFYLPFLIVNSLVIFGLLNSKDTEFFYSVGAFLSLNLAFWIDSVNFNRLINGLLNGMEKMLNK